MALFNWLYARHTGGRFRLRIEDTDRDRHSDAAVQIIFDTLSWLGLQTDGDPVFQFARAPVHQKIVAQMVESGHAFRCFLTVEEADAAKLEARAAGHALRSPWRDRSAKSAPAAAFVVRFKVPEGETVIDDVVRGAVRFPNKDLDDLILLRTNGDPTYNLAVAADDHEMGVTHVIRGEDHLSNAARQALIYDAMGWRLPTFAHLPLIVGPDGAKLSKRHGAQSVADFASAGYLPEALRNYLARLGWGHGDDELFTDAQAIEWFDLKDVVRAPAKLDLNKLAHVNNHYIRTANEDRLASLAIERLKGGAAELPVNAEHRLRAAIPAVKEGARTIVDLVELLRFALKDRPLALDEKTLAQLTQETRARLARLAESLRQVEPWMAAKLEARLRDFAAAEGVGLGKIGPALRGVLSGGSPAPDLAGTLGALGREESLGRIQDALSQAR